MSNPKPGYDGTADNGPPDVGTPNERKPGEGPPDEGPSDEPWADLRSFTPARIALGRAGDGLPTRHLLDFQLAHARARDAVHMPMDVGLVRDQLAGQPDFDLDIIEVRSAAPARADYLKRPDLGRVLAAGEGEKLPQGPHDAVFVIADGLSARAIHDHGVKTLMAAVGHLADWRLAPLVLVREGRVAISDEIGRIIGAELAVILIGERPGLTAADSLGAYLTYAPGPGRQNAHRNCISNVHLEGLTPENAGFKIAQLMKISRKKKLSGVDLKDDATLLDGVSQP